ncbi:MAG: hypothetical protein QOK10_2817 [Pseudonocardiales bacterium]|jgi:hypothetical protein|nr:hypothetical protein [Pseudonocardiales bacterium]
MAKFLLLPKPLSGQTRGTICSPADHRIEHSVSPRRPSCADRRHGAGCVCRRGSRTHAAASRPDKPMSRRRFGTVRGLPSGAGKSRYRGDSGLMRSAPVTFERRADADRWLAQEEVAVLNGDGVSLAAGPPALGDYAEAWVRERANPAAEDASALQTARAPPYQSPHRACSDPRRHAGPHSYRDRSGYAMLREAIRKLQT